MLWRAVEGVTRVRLRSMHIGQLPDAQPNVSRYTSFVMPGRHMKVDDLKRYPQQERSCDKTVLLIPLSTTRQLSATRWLTRPAARAALPAGDSNVRVH
jgi:hypothetical protein